MERFEKQHLERILRHCLDSGFAPRITQKARQMQTVVSLVAAGMGVALVPASMRNLRRSGVRYHRLRKRHGALEIGTLISAGEDRAIVRHFAEALADAASAAGD